VVGLVTAIIVLLGIWYFASRVSDYYDQIQTGVVDLSAFSSPEEISQLQGSQGAISDLPPELAVHNFADDPAIGAEDAELVIVAFEDFQCPFCGAVEPEIQTMLARHSDRIRFVYRDFPIAELHPQAAKAAEAGQCAHEQGQFWPYHDLLYRNQAALTVSDLKRYAAELQLNTAQFDNCLDTGKYTEEVSDDFADGVRAGVTGTPTFFFNGNRVAGVITAAGFDQIIHYFTQQ
jgi:protein-disulfide isomerase